MSNQNQIQKPTQHQENEFNTKMSLFYLTYFILIISVKYFDTGLVSLLELGWLCHIGILLCAIAHFFGKREYVAATIGAVAFPHLFWVLDFVLYLLIGYFPFGISSYLIWPDYSWIGVLVTLHHVWFIPLVIFTLKRWGMRLEWRHMKLGFYMQVVVTLMTRVFVPYEYDGVYLNVNLAHKMWVDAPQALRYFDEAPVAYFVFGNMLAGSWSTISFAIIKLVADLTVF
eukprot:TRINITY_DN3410_c0_g1_i1.p1 TRINITY_DN3410_c0_g1~~TRINITY_DN3410_c0_g1_i1.p1  ORF type:complete len:228 (+),score=30.88 TRINITY_DN3410_c0_g1_i1:25-708(+)